MSLLDSENTFTLKDLSSLVSVSEEVLLVLVLLTFKPQNNSAILRSLLLELLESETKSGLNGLIALLLQPESTSQEIQSPSSQDASLLFATTDKLETPSFVILNNKNVDARVRLLKMN